MIAEVLLVLAGHSSSLEALGHIASRYRNIKKACATLSRSKSRYVCALCATLNQILKDEYEKLVVDTEAKVLKRDPDLVANGSFVPLSAVRATFAEWDSPLTALETLMNQLQAQKHWKPGPLIDMLLARSKTGVYRIADIISRLSVAVQRVWRSQLSAFVVHGSLASSDPLASEDFTLLDGAMPSCVSPQTKESIVYVGRAIATIKAKKWQNQLPREQALEYANLLETVLPEDQYKFDLVISQIRTNVSEWLWLNVLTRKDVEDAVISLASYFLLRNGEFSLALIREIERLKISRLTTRSGVASRLLAQAAQHDPSLLHLHFELPSGPLRPLLPSLANSKALSSSVASNSPETTSFDDLLLGTNLVLSFCTLQDLQIYAALFNYLSSLRKTHTQIHTCWTSLSNAQRARRRWTGLGEGGTAEDLEARRELLRCGWGVVRDMGWFLDTLLGYVMVDVIDVEFRRLKDLLGNPSRGRAESVGKHPSSQNIAGQANADPSTYLDFTTLRNIHTTYLERLLTGCLLSNPALTAILRPIFEVCERFVAQVERWGGDVLPALLFEGSLAPGGDDKVGAMVQERFQVVSEINESLHKLLNLFYEQLSLSTSQQPFTATGDILKRTSIRGKGSKGFEGEGEVRRHVERLLLRLDFNGAFSKPRAGASEWEGGIDIL
ncbi:gamma-tubulin ring complex protein [Suillus subalutaceus]|uniref:gamma-tubulin ring complex protein n=1 Tax=Suillus subalutaceus TaxID=48586 RepID=UPI001B864FD2|nr:gamma-tubulin ring complex protein [Suillus subalutaceus]KAG1864714.1 gamma-tubulin ring complex protein [Suillus subalutaceus]